MSEPSFEELRRELMERQKRLTDLVRQRAELLNKVDALDTQIEKESGMSVQAVIEQLNSEYIDGQSAVEEIERDIRRLTTQKRAEKGDTIPSLIGEILELHPKGLKPAELSKKILERGYKTKSKKFSVTVGQALFKMRQRGEIKRLNNGRYVMK